MTSTFKILSLVAALSSFTSVGAHAQASAAAASGPTTRAQVKAETKAAEKQGTLIRGGDTYGTGDAPSVKPRPPKAKASKRRDNAAASAPQ